jgi:RND superfamily putative drug exporter
MVGLGLMAMAEFAKVRYAGPAIALSLGVALLASLTLTPALLRLVGRFVFWPTTPPAAGPVKILSTRLRPDQETGFWDRISRGVARHPAKVWLCSFAIIAPLVYVGLQVKPSYRATGELAPTSESLQGLAAIQRHFTAGEIGPITVLLAAPVDWDSREGRLEIDHLTRGFASLPNVAEVRSLTRPLGNPLPDPPMIADPETYGQKAYNYIQPYLQMLIEQVRAESRDHFVAQLSDEKQEKQPDAAKKPVSVTRLDVVLKSDPFAAESNETLSLIKTWLKTEGPTTCFIKCEVQAECFGITANACDLAELTESDRQRVNLLVLAAIFAILLVLVRSLWLAVYLLVTVLASYYAALGATVLVGVLWTGAILPSLDWRVPFFLFTILVAVGEDYNILLVHRAMQEQRRHGVAEGMRRALAKTGGAITSCGLIMAGTFATLMLAGLGTLLQIGFALAFGVLVDTFLVRPFLVPAFAILCWKAGAPAPIPPVHITSPTLDVPDKTAIDSVLAEFPKAA